MKAVERERTDWIVILILVVIGFLFLIIAGQLALRFSASWQLNTNMDSHLDPNSAFLTRRPGGLIEPIDSSILTLPSWIDSFLTPGAPIVTGTPFPRATSTSPAVTATVPLTTGTTAVTQSPTATIVYSPPTWTATSRPGSTATSTGNPTSMVTITNTSIPPVTATPSSTGTVTQTSTATGTPTSTATTTATSTHTPIPIPTDPIPPEIGTTPDGVTYDLPAGGVLTLGINLVANGDAGYDLVYYEFPTGTGILMDWVIIEISDGNNWYTIFYWGNDIADTNSNMDFTILPNPVVPPEQDQRDVPSSALYNSTGIAIDIDSIVPPGTYSYIRFTAPAGDADGQMEIDAIEVLP